MPEKLVCDRCGVTYTDDESVQSLKTGLRAGRHSVRGIASRHEDLAPARYYLAQGN